MRKHQEVYCNTAIMFNNDNRIDSESFQFVLVSSTINDKFDEW